MKDETYCVVAFNSTHHAIKGEKKLQDKGVKIKTIPTPREITASCGLSIRFEPDLLHEVKEIIDEDRLDIKGIYKVKKDKSGRVATEI